MSVRDALRGWIDELEGVLCASLALERIALPTDLATREGTWKGAPATIETRAFAGGPAGYARFVRIRGCPEIGSPSTGALATEGEPISEHASSGLEIANLLCLPRHDVPLPMLGADLVWLGRDTAMVAADLVPTARDVAGPMLSARLAGLAPVPSAGDLPAWAVDWFSPHALFTRATHAELPAVWPRLRAYASVYAELAQQVAVAPSEESAIRAAVDGYGAAHRDGDRALAMLGKIFGEEWAARFVCEVLFPIEARA